MLAVFLSIILLTAVVVVVWIVKNRQRTQSVEEVDSSIAVATAVLADSEQSFDPEVPVAQAMVVHAGAVDVAALPIAKSLPSNV